MRMADLDRWIVEGMGDEFTYVVDPPGYKIKGFRCPYGDFLKAYMDHLNMSWWRKGREWRKVEEKMRNILNGRSFVMWFDKAKQ